MNEIPSKHDPDGDLLHRIPSVHDPDGSIPYDILIEIDKECDRQDRGFDLDAWGLM